MPEDFNKLRQINRQLVHTNFQMEWQFRFEMEEEPPEFDLFVKDVSYGVFDTATEEDQYGSATFVWPVATQAIRMSVTVRDHEDGRIRDFLKDWHKKVILPNGTVGLPYGPNGYVKKVKRYDLTTDGQEKLEAELEMYPIQCGDISRSRANGEFMEFPVTFVQFSTPNDSSGDG